MHFHACEIRKHSTSLRHWLKVTLSLTRNLQGPGAVTRDSSRQFRLIMCKRATEQIPALLSGGLFRLHQEDMAASSCQQNTISRLGGLSLLHQKVVDLAPPYSQCYSAAICYTNTLSQLALTRTVFQWIPGFWWVPVFR